MLTELLQYLRNYFETAKYHGDFIIEDGVVISRNDGDMGILNGQYFRVIGSALNDGVWRKPDTELVNETFSGSVWVLSVPRAVISLASEIDAWRAKYEAVDSAAMSPYQSESFGGYSYSKGAAGSAGGASWQNVFASRLNAWRKI